MKAFTDISQSKKLAEILPLESADMMYHSVEMEYGSGAFVATSKVITNGAENDDFYIDDIPCWSLAALISALSLEIETHKQTDGYKIYYYVELYMKRMGKEIYLSTERHENLVDACYEMIVKLHEQNIL